jgi:hypothetical protein
LWFFRKPDEEKLKHSEEEDGDPRSKPSLYLKLLSFSLTSSGLRKNHIVAIFTHIVALPPF